MVNNIHRHHGKPQIRNHSLRNFILAVHNTMQYSTHLLHHTIWKSQLLRALTATSNHGDICGHVWYSALLWCFSLIQDAFKHSATFSKTKSWFRFHRICKNNMRLNITCSHTGSATLLQCVWDIVKYVCHKFGRIEPFTHNKWNDALQNATWISCGNCILEVDENPVGGASGAIITDILMKWIAARVHSSSETQVHFDWHF